MFANVCETIISVCRRFKRAYSNAGITQSTQSCKWVSLNVSEVRILNLTRILYWLHVNTAIETTFSAKMTQTDTQKHNDWLIIIAYSRAQMQFYHNSHGTQAAAATGRCASLPKELCKVEGEFMHTFNTAGLTGAKKSHCDSVVMGTSILVQLWLLAPKHVATKCALGITLAMCSEWKYFWTTIVNFFFLLKHFMRIMRSQGVLYMPHYCLIKYTSEDKINIVKMLLKMALSGLTYLCMLSRDASRFVTLQWHKHWVLQLGCD